MIKSYIPIMLISNRGDGKWEFGQGIILWRLTLNVSKSFLNTYFITLNGEEICIKRKAGESQKKA